MDRRTSLPVAYFDVRLANHTDSKRTLSVMFTMPNVPAHVHGTQADMSVPFGPDSIREGFENSYCNEGQIHSISMSADGDGNTPDAAHSEWTMAVLQSDIMDLTYTTSWNAEGDGSDVYRAFPMLVVCPKELSMHLTQPEPCV